MKKYYGIIAAVSFLAIVILSVEIGKGAVLNESVRTQSSLVDTALSTADSHSTAASVTESTSHATSQQSEETSEKESDDFPDVSLEDWSMVLVGPKNKIDQEIAQSGLAKLSNGYLVDKRIVSAYEDLAEAADQAGYPLVMVSAYRSVAYQKQIFAENVATLMSRGDSQEEATKTTKLTFTEPGYSEHHTGLAIDVVDKAWYQDHTTDVLDHQFGDTDGGKWIQVHAREYGFIVRYPKGKYAITQIDYEPWHLRYVGVEAATYIEDNQLTFEEFIDQAKER
ncbi:hypothetical protein A5886_001776 [Enterococcus sp. 8G7_MSG3316]|uniref:D-alanyl-D-alanine carboxypeptidase-like core domain-containing protein n=1 Tax=Candidatus Enterococcus testudinis TaxID=1834191 RepID=A0A242A6N4_9ENTE|nr:M15 family metallopeptidase [Enterococcus sp. 8G7_MSG3316]OTN76698.1 hypothetical protein A5886_001776 [Enterococcus sp. 8G7_MSG3316]